MRLLLNMCPRHSFATSQHELTCDDRPKILQPTTWDKKKKLLNDQFKHRDICGYVQ